MPREVTVLYFAEVREILGISETLVVLPDEVRTVGAFRTLLEQTHAPLRGRLGSVRFAVNEAFADDDHEVENGDVIAVIPPVSGG